MEVSGCKPLRFKDFLRARQAKGREHALLKLIIGHPVLFTAAEVVEPVPEFFRDIVPADIRKQTTGIFNRCPLEHSAHRNMEGCRIYHTQYSRIEDTGLANRHPMTDSGIHNGLFRLALRHRIHVIAAGKDRVSGSPPMEGKASVPILSNRTDIYHLDFFGIWLGQNSLCDILRREDIDFQGLLRIIVRGWRNHAPDMQDIVRTLNSFENIFIYGQVSPDYGDRRVIHIWRELIDVLF